MLRDISGSSATWKTSVGRSRLKGRGRADTTARVFLISRYALSSYLLQSVLQRDCSIEIVGTGRPDHELLASITAVHPHVIVMEAFDRPSEEIELLTALRRGYPQGRILVIGAEPHDRQLLFARLGVAGCLPERIDLQGLGKAIHLVSSGGILFYRDAPQPPYADGDVSWLQHESFSALTQRETEILHGAAEGLGDRQIGQSLTMAPSTVRMHLRSVYRKLRVRNRAQAVAVAAANGLLDTPPLVSEASWRRET